MTVVFSVIIVVGTIFSVSMDQYIQIYDPDWYGLLSYDNDKVKDEKKIFIIGSSSVYAINATYINEQLALNKKIIKYIILQTCLTLQESDLQVFKI